MKSFLRQMYPVTCILVGVLLGHTMGRYPYASWSTDPWHYGLGVGLISGAVGLLVAASWVIKRDSDT